MTKIYELIEATRSVGADGRNVWECFGEDYASPEALAELSRIGYPEHAKRMKELYAAGDYRGVVKLFDEVMYVEIGVCATNGFQWAKDWLELVREKEIILDLVLKYGTERTRNLIELDRESERVVFGRRY